jgi:hypothetical protein
MLAVNPVVALWMEQGAVFGTRGTTHHSRDAIMNAPARDPGDLGVAHGAEPALKLPVSLLTGVVFDAKTLTFHQREHYRGSALDEIAVR